MSTGEEWGNCFTLKDISVPLNLFIGLSAMTSDVTDAHEYALFASCLYPPGYLTQPQPLLEYRLCYGIFCYPLRRRSITRQTSPHGDRRRLDPVLHPLPDIWRDDCWSLVWLESI